MQDRTAITREEITFAANDRFPLAGTLFEGHGDGPLALISSAAAVPRGIYAASPSIWSRNAASVRR